jgi:uncharacterized coiled-coil DUF342 family protein
MIWRNVKSKVKIFGLNLAAVKVQATLTTALEELAECTTKRDEFNKLAQELRTQLDNTLRMNLVYLSIGDLGECQNKRGEFNKQAQDLRAQLGRTQSTSCDDIWFR